MDWIRGRQHKIQVCRTNREVTYKTINMVKEKFLLYNFSSDILKA